YSAFVDALERAEEECRQCGVAAAMAAGTTLGQAAVNSGLGAREAADCAAGAALRAATEFGMAPADAAVLGGRAAAKLAAEQNLDRAQAADAAAEAAGMHSLRAAVEAKLTLEQCADEAAIAASAAAEEAGSTAQHVAEASARAAGIAAGEIAADSGNTAMKSAEIAAKAATKSAAAAGLPPYQAVDATATAAARSAARAAINAGHPYLIVAEVTRQLNAQLVENLREAHQGKDMLTVPELKDLFSQANIDIHEDTLRQVYEEMGADPNGQLSFESFFQALEKAHSTFMEAGLAAANLAGRVMGQAAADAGDDPEQAGEVAANAATAAAKTAGLSEQQVAEVAVAAAGHAAGSAALAAGGTPEHVAYVAGQAAINAATTAGLNTQLLPQVIVPVFARAAGRAAAQSNGRDTAACCERAAKAATEAGEKLAFMTQEQVQEAAEAASNEASRVFAAGGPKPAPGRDAGRGRASGTGATGRGRGTSTSSTPARPAPKPKPAAKKAAARPAPGAKAKPKPKAAPKEAPKAAPRPKPKAGSVTNSARSATRPESAGLRSAESTQRSQGPDGGEEPAPKAKAKAKSSSKIPSNARLDKVDKVPSEKAQAPEPAPAAAAPEPSPAPVAAPAPARVTMPSATLNGDTSPKRHGSGVASIRMEVEKEPSLATGRTAVSQTQPPLKAVPPIPASIRVTQDGRQMLMEPVAAPFRQYTAQCGSSLQVPTQVQRFYTPYVVSRPASATIPVAPGNSISVMAQLSPSSVFRSPSQPAMVPGPRHSLRAPVSMAPCVPQLPLPQLPQPLPPSLRTSVPAASSVRTLPGSGTNSLAPSNVPAPYARSMPGSFSSTPGRYQPMVVTSPPPQMRVIEPPPVGTMTAPPPTVTRFETNQGWPGVNTASWRTLAEPVAGGMAQPYQPFSQYMAYPPNTVYHCPSTMVPAAQ
ncbi:unnamed protein product, partial [Effrenium voratum]